MTQEHIKRFNMLGLEVVERDSRSYVIHHSDDLSILVFKDSTEWVYHLYEGFYVDLAIAKLLLEVLEELNAK